MKRGLLLAALATASAAHAVPAAAQEAVAPGLPEPLERFGTADYDWRLRDLEGGAVHLDAFRGRVLFINLWASWCRPCVVEMEHIEALATSLEDTDVQFLLVSPEDPDPVRRFVRRHGPELPVYVEETEIPPAFGLVALPTTFVVDRDGGIVLRHRGAADWDDDGVRAFLRHLDGAPSAGRDSRR